MHRGLEVSRTLRRWTLTPSHTVWGKWGWGGRYRSSASAQTKRGGSPHPNIFIRFWCSKHCRGTYNISLLVFLLLVYVISHSSAEPVASTTPSCWPVVDFTTSTSMMISSTPLSLGSDNYHIVAERGGGVFNKKGERKLMCLCTNLIPIYAFAHLS